METTVFTCKNCGYPLNVPSGAESITCPQCRGTNALPSKVDANAKIQLTLLELQTAKDEYQAFLPKKEMVTRKLDAELANFDRLHHRKHSDPISSMVLFLIMLIIVVPFLIALLNAREGEFWHTFIFGLIFTLPIDIIIMVKIIGTSAHKSKRVEKERKLMQIRDKWTREDEEYKAKIAELEGILRKFRGA